MLEAARAQQRYEASKARLNKLKKERDQARLMVREYLDIDQPYESADGVRVKVT